MKRLATQSLALHCQPCDLFRHFCRSCIFHPLRRGPSFSRSCIFQPCDLVRHFPGPAFSSPEIWSVIFQVLHFPAIWSVIFQFLHFPALRIGPSFSRSCIVQVLHFQSPPNIHISHTLLETRIPGLQFCCGDTVVYWSKYRQNRQFVPTPVSEIALARGDPYRIS